MGNCSCVYVGNDYDPPEFHRAIIRKAIKDHVCCECKRTVRRGEKYEYVSALYDGHISNYKTCEDCLSIRDELFCEGWYYTKAKEYLWEYLQDVDGEISEDCLVVLTPRARSMICDMIEEIWEVDENG